MSRAVLPSLAKVGIHEVEQLDGHRTGELLRRPELSSGVELYELICELHRHGLTPFSGHGGHIHTAREREMFRLRAVEGLTLGVASSPRQVQRAFAQFGESTFRQTANALSVSPATALIAVLMDICHVADVVGWERG